MAINIKFDTAGNPEPPSIILATKNGNKLGLLNVNADSIELNDKLKISEISFTLNKYIDGKLNNLWDKVVDFKLVWCKEWDCWFEIKVELDEATETVKTIFGTQLGQAELSQIMVYNMEVNTEEDIARDDYKIAILYDENDHEASLLHRILKDKAPHYSIAYVDPTIARIQRQFSWDGSSICDVLDEVEEEIGCLVVYNSNSTEGGMPNRSISVYDLEQNCNDCGYRGEFTDECPKCGSKNIKYGYGEDTTIFVTNDELASDGIELVTDVDSVKNCFKLEAGDDLMTATIRNCNPNGSDYIWRFSNDIKEDMSDELVEKLESYDAEYKRYYNEHESNLDTTLLTQYNNLVEKYDDFYNTDSTCLNCDNEGEFYDKCPSCDSENLLTGKELQKIDTPIVGYPSLMNAYYNTIDFALYLESSLMPSITMSDTTAEEQASLLTTISLSPVAVNVKVADSITVTTANSAVLSMAKVIVRSTYKIEILSSTLSDENEWSGTFKITNYSDDTDKAEVVVNDIVVNNDAETFIKQKIEKALNKENTDDYSITGLFEKEYDEFCTELTKYALNPLKSFYDAADTCISILTEQGAGDEANKPDLYEKLYLPYFQKQEAIASEISIRENELAIIEGIYDETTKTTSGGLQNNIRNCQSVIQDALNFEDYLGEDLWKEFCSFRREDKYSNSNYISDGLNNAQLFKRALEFLDVAENEIYKSSELQHSISTSLNNLLAIDKFKPLVKYFKNGNWIRVRVDDKIYKLRLLEYSINFGSFESIPVEFSDVTKIKNSITDVKDVLEQTSSVASSYDAVTRQAKKGNVAKSTIEQWIDDGLNAANVQIQSNDSEEIIITKNGLLGRSYDDITGTYSPEQLKITHNIMAYTDDNWETVSSALGRHSYNRWNGSSFVDEEGYGLTSKFVTAGYITGSQIIGGEILSSNYEPKTKGTYINLLNGDFDFAGGKIVYDADDNNVILKGVTIQWTGDDGVNAPEVKVENVTGLDKYLDQLDNLEDQLDGRVQTYSQSEDPSESWTDEEKVNHIGDLWLNPDNGITKRWTGTNWVEVTDSDLKKLAQSKAQIFTSTPIPPYYVGDLWVQGSTGDILHCVKGRESGDYVETDWEISSKYTDDTRANEAYGLADSAKGIADNAKIIGDKLVNGLGFQETEITGGYIISPVIAGGHLLIGDTAGTYAQIETNGKLTCTDADVSGHITATSLKLGTGVQISANTDISGLSDVATSGKYSDLSDSPDLSVYATIDSLNNYVTNSSLSIQLASYATTGQLTDYLKTNDLNAKLGELNVSYRGDIQTTQSTDNETGIITTTSTYIGADGTKHTTTTYTTKESDYVLLSRDNQWGIDDTLVKISKNGLLEAKNANISGAIYASEGSFAGDIIADSLTLRKQIQLGNETDGYHTWINPDGTLSTQDAIISGEITAPKGSIGGFTIETTDTNENGSKSGGWLYGGTNIGDNESIFLSATDMSGIVSNTAASDWRVTVGRNFGVTSDGTAYMSNCEITGGSLRIGSENSGYYAWISEDGVLNAVGANIDGIITATSGAIGKCTIDTDGAITSANGNFLVDAQGNLKAAGNGSIGGFTIGNNSLNSGYNSINPTFGTRQSGAVYLGTDGIRLGDKFSVNENGEMVVTGGQFSGNVTAETGNIGDFSISGNQLQGDDLYINQNGIIIGDLNGHRCEILYNSESGSLFWTPSGTTKFACGDKQQTYIELSNDGKNTTNYTFTVQAARYNGYHDSGATNYDYCYAYRVAINETRPYDTKITVYFYTSLFQNTTVKEPTVTYTFTIPAYSEYSDWWHESNLLNDAWGVLSTRYLKISFEENSVYIAGEANNSTGYNLSDGTFFPINDSIDKIELYQSLLPTKALNLESDGNSTGTILFNTNIIPTTNGTYNLGSTSKTWNNLYISGTAYNSSGSVVDISDLHLKNTINPLSKTYSQMFDELIPVTYKYNIGTSDRLHIGFIAQDVKSAMDDAGITTKDFAGYCEWKKEDGTIECGLRYSEFIALCVSEIQKLKRRVAELENK